MRIGGLASGMDIDSLVGKLMEAERMPLQKMEQDQTKLTWQRDSFRDINKKLLELDDMMLNMKMSSTYNSKSVSSSNESAVTATASSSADNGLYNIEVTQMATSAINISQSAIGQEIDPNESMNTQQFTTDVNNGTYKFSTYDEETEGMKEHTFEVKDGDSLNDVLKRITDADNNVRAFFDEPSQKVIMETIRTGNYNENGSEIDFNGTDNAFFTDVLNLDPTQEDGGENAQFTYNGLATVMESKTNSYQLNGVNFQFKSEGSASLTVTNNVESSFEKIMDFVDKYNEVVETLNGTQQEEKFRDYKPLTDEQKEDMSEKQIELWEEKAKSGLLRGESSISSGLFSMRQSWYSTVETGGDITSLTQIGIKTSSNYMDGGKLEVNETDLKNALRDNPGDVQKLFSNNAEGDSRGLVNRLEDAVESTMSKIEERAGKGTDTLENYTLGKRMKDVTTRIAAFEDRLVQKENRYWSQFTQMEKAIQRMNQQSAQLAQFSGGGGMM
ncbi:flagellar hook-associated protein 2 [Virgibacillus byunsanensis]|uniref:Flagellar hook-associated protein 2 n=1 Tax=Virgibacillus byunsanensis TaxID=570945 RepID=A0ABW3LM40_9BACI